MGIITILWEKWVEFRRDFYKITLAAMIAPLMYLVRNGNPDNVPRTAVPEFPYPGCRISDNDERKLQCHCPESECPEIIREGL